MTLDHVESSELLGPLVAGSLDPARRAELERHLATCTECSDELRALNALVALVALESVELTPDERARLRTAIAPAARRRPTWARFMPALATAAVVALGVVAYGALDLGGSDEAGVAPALQEGADEPRGAARDGAATGQAESLEAAMPGAIGDEGVAGNTTRSRASAGRGGAATTAEADTLMAAPQRGGAFAATALDPALLSPAARRLEYFARAVPAAWSAQLETCTRRLFASQPVTLTLAYAQAFPRDDLLVAGFLWSEATSGEPTDYAFWGWWRGDCDTASPVHVRGTL